MLENNKKISRIKILFGITLTAILAITSYIYLPKVFIKKEIHYFVFSKPDERPETIKGETITLKRLQPSYFQEYLKMINDPVVLKPLYFPKKITYSWIKKYLEKDLKKENIGKTFLYIIFDNKDKKLIGSLEIREPNPKDPGQFGCWLNPKYWGQGRLQEAFQLISDAYFKIKKADKFTAHVEMWNLRSYYALKKCGFKLIKTLHFQNQPSRYLLEFYNPYKYGKQIDNNKANSDLSENGRNFMNKKVLFILMPEKYKDEEFLKPYEILKQKGISIDVAGLKTGAAKGVNGHEFTPNILLSNLTNADFDSYDALIIPGGPGSVKYLWNNKKIQEVILDFHKNKKIVATICYAVIVAVQSGILNGKNATVYPTQEAKDILQKHNVNFLTDGCVTLDDDKIITAQGPKFAEEFAQQIVKLLEK